MLSATGWPGRLGPKYAFVIISWPLVSLWPSLSWSMFSSPLRCSRYRRLHCCMSDIFRDAEADCALSAQTAQTAQELFEKHRRSPTFSPTSMFMVPFTGRLGILLIHLCTVALSVVKPGSVCVWLLASLIGQAALWAHQANMGCHSCVSNCCQQKCFVYCSIPACFETAFKPLQQGFHV